MRFEPKHWLIVAGLVSGVATQLATAQHGWSDTLTTGFVAGLLLQVGSTITAIFVGAPGADADLARANRNTDVANASTRAALSTPRDLRVVVKTERDPEPPRLVGPDDYE